MNSEEYPYKVYTDVILSTEVLNLLHDHTATLIRSERMRKLSDTQFIHTDFLAESVFSKLFKEKTYCELHVAFQNSEISVERDVTKVFSLSESISIIPCTFDHPKNQSTIPLEINELAVIDPTRVNLFTRPLNNHLICITMSKKPIVRNFLEIDASTIEFPPLKKFEKPKESGPLFGYRSN